MKSHKKKPTPHEIWKASYKDFWRRQKLWQNVKGIEGCGSSSTEAKLRNMSPDGAIARFISYNVPDDKNKERPYTYTKTPYMYEEYDVEGNLLYTEVIDGFEI